MTEGIRVTLPDGSVFPQSDRHLSLYLTLNLY